jgi:hypothetical protein
MWPHGFDNVKNSICGYGTQPRPGLDFEFHAPNTENMVFKIEFEQLEKEVKKLKILIRKNFFDHFY